MLKVQCTWSLVKGRLPEVVAKNRSLVRQNVLSGPDFLNIHVQAPRFPRFQIISTLSHRAFVEFDKAQILDREPRWFERGVTEAIYIRFNKPSLNKDGERYKLPKVYDSIITSSINVRSGNSEVYSSKGVFTCRRVIITAGAWLNNILSTIGVTIPVTVTQEQVTYFRTPHVKDCGKSRFPVFIYHLPDFDVYGLPSHGNTYSKIGIDAGMSPTVTAQTRNFKPDPKREKFCVDFLKENIPKFLGPIAYTKTCLYTMTADRNFVIDTCDKVNFPEVIVCCGAGHAYKFSSILGKTLSDLALNRKSPYNIEPFKISRPAVTDSAFKKDYHFRTSVKEKYALQSHL